MLWAIDVGNTHTVIGRWDGVQWHAVWRLETDPMRTEEELAVQLKVLCDLTKMPFTCEKAILGSVVPSMNPVILDCFREWLHCPVKVLKTGDQVGLKVTYDPPHAVGADRIANALGALAILPPPVVVVDFGTATTFDVVDSEGSYVGGAILPGVTLSAAALSRNTAKLPPIAIRVPEAAIGRNTVQALESGIVWGYAGAVDSVARRILDELGAEAPILATGGLGKVFSDICPSITRYEPNLTLEGLRLAWDMIPA